MNNDNLSDLELWNKTVLDDPGAFARLYDRHWASLFKTASHYSQDQNLAEEIVHDVFVTLWQRRKFLKINNFRNYIVYLHDIKFLEKSSLVKFHQSGM